MAFTFSTQTMYMRPEIPHNLGSTKVKEGSAALSIVLPERAWEKKPGDKTYKVEDLEGKVEILVQNRFKAAQEALSDELLSDKTPPEKKGRFTIESALKAFGRLNQAIEDALRYKTSLSLPGMGENQGTEIPYEHVILIFSDLNYKIVRELADTCQDIVDRLRSGEAITPQKMQDLREKINRVLKSYEALPEGYKKEKTINVGLHAPFLQFLGALSFHINTQAEGMQVMETIGAEALNACCSNPPTNATQGVSVTEIAGWTEEVFTKVEADNWDSTQGHLLWSLKSFKNLYKFILAQIDNFIPDGYTLYNSHKLDNFFSWIGNFKVAGKAGYCDLDFSFNLGPSLTSDSLSKAQLLWQKIKGWLHLQHTLESNHKRGESARLGEQRDLAKECEKSFKLMSTTLDGDVAKGKGKFKKIKSVEDFHTKLKTLLIPEPIPENTKQHTGFANPILDSVDIADTIAASQGAFATVLSDVKFDKMNEEQNKRLCKVMLLGFTGFFVLKTMLKLGDTFKEKSKEEVAQCVAATLGQACKQDVDRGPIVNAITIAFVQMAGADQGLTGRDAQQLIGILLGRAMMVDDRTINKDRLEVFVDLLSLIGQNEGAFTAELQAFIGTQEDGSSRITFIPSNAKSVDEPK